MGKSIISQGDQKELEKKYNSFIENLFNNVLSSDFDQINKYILVFELYISISGDYRLERYFIKNNNR